MIGERNTAGPQKGALMIRFRTTVLRTAAVAVLGLAVIGVPTAANAAPANVQAPVVQQDACALIRLLAGPVLQWLDLGLINYDTAVALIVSITGLPEATVRGCVPVPA